MFNRTAPRALALTFAIVVVFILAIVAITAIPVATAPSGARVANCAEFDGGNPTNVVGGACFLPTTTHTNGDDWPNLDTAAYGTDIPRCASDDWNSTHLARCYTLRVTDGAAIIIDADDNTLATLK